jgi:hypothetical protein
MLLVLKLLSGRLVNALLWKVSEKKEPQTEVMLLISKLPAGKLVNSFSEKALAKK